MVDVGSGARREIIGIALSRYACYLDFPIDRKLEIMYIMTLHCSILLYRMVTKGWAKGYEPEIYPFNTNGDGGIRTRGRVRVVNAL